MATKRKVYSSNQERILDFVGGFFGWYLLNGLCWLPARGEIEALESFQNLLLLPLNVILLIVFLIIRRWIGYGILTAVALNLVIALIIGVTINAWCAIPFFVPE